MTVDKHTKVVGMSGKYSPHQSSIFAFHVLRSQPFQLFALSSELYSSSRKKFHALSNSSEARSPLRRSLRDHASFEHTAASLPGLLASVDWANLLSSPQAHAR